MTYFCAQERFKVSLHYLEFSVGLLVIGQYVYLWYILYNIYIYIHFFILDSFGRLMKFWLRSFQGFSLNPTGGFLRIHIDLLIGLVVVLPADFDAEIAADGARKGICWIGLAQHLTASFDDVGALPDHGDDRS